MGAANELGIGIKCARCGQGLNDAYIAKSYPIAHGHFRTRHCPCGHETRSLERIIDTPEPKVAVFTGIRGHDLGVVRRVIEAMGGRVFG